MFQNTRLSVTVAPPKSLPAPGAQTAVRDEQRDAGGCRRRPALPRAFQGAHQELNLVGASPGRAMNVAGMAHQDTHIPQRHAFAGAALADSLSACSPEHAKLGNTRSAEVAPSGVSPEIAAYVAGPAFLDDVLKALAADIKKRAVIVSGFVGGKPPPADIGPDAIHLMYSRNPASGLVALRIVTTDSDGVSTESPAHTFAKPSGSWAEKLQRGRLVFDGVTIALRAQNGLIPKDQPQHMRTGIVVGYQLRTRIAKALNPKMESAVLGEAMAAFCVVPENREACPVGAVGAGASPQSMAVGMPGNTPAKPNNAILNPRRANKTASAKAPPAALPRDAASFKQDLRAQLTRHLRKPGWWDVELVITGLTGMNEKLPADLETYVHVTYEQKPDGDVGMQIEARNKRYPELNRSRYREFSQSEYRLDDTLYKELLFWGVYGVTRRKNVWPDQKAIHQFRDDIGGRLNPPMTGRILAGAVLEYKPIARSPMPRPSAVSHNLARLAKQQQALLARRAQVLEIPEVPVLAMPAQVPEAPVVLAAINSNRRRHADADDQLASRPPNPKKKWLENAVRDAANINAVDPTWRSLLRPH